jgi:hypothetical protein
MSQHFADHSRPKWLYSLPSVLLDRWSQVDTPVSTQVPVIRQVTTKYTDAVIDQSQTLSLQPVENGHVICVPHSLQHYSQRSRCGKNLSVDG